MTHSIFNGELALRGFQLSGKYYCGLSHILCEKDTEHKNFWLKFVICCVVHRKAASHQRLYQKQNDEYFLCVEFCFHYLSRKHYINIDPRRNTKERKKKKELGTPERNHKAKYQKDEIPRERARVRFV